eukprot:GHVR01027578.1.p1 GENE.GHVR01027578.1~~GHVR01027578.1.p1  ORF type:complete len:116 (-),score=16.52 GHVR01027578.1:641-988(-)
MKTDKILVTGPFGQIGAELVPELQKQYGKDNVIALGHHIPTDFKGIVEKGDIRNYELKNIIEKHKINQIYHLAAVLSVTGEEKPNIAWDVNLISLKTILDLCIEYKIDKYSGQVQ